MNTKVAVRTVERTQVMLLCDVCGAQYARGDDEEQAWHPDVDAAWRALVGPCESDGDGAHSCGVGLHVAGDPPTVLCRVCAHDADCARLGHLWRSLGPESMECSHCGAGASAADVRAVVDAMALLDAAGWHTPTERTVALARHPLRSRP